MHDAIVGAMNHAVDSTQGNVGPGKLNQKLVLNHQDHRQQDGGVEQNRHLKQVFEVVRGNCGISQ